MDILRKLEEAGAVHLDKHFVYKSAKHGSGYIDMDPLFTEIQLMWQLGVELWRPFAATTFDTIASPAVGGIALAYATAYTLKYEVDVGSGGPTRAVVWADKDGADFTFARAGFIDQIRDKRVLIVEDLLTTGGSVAKVVHEVERNNGEVVGVSAVCNRGGVTAGDLGVPRLESLAQVSFEAIEANQCPLCVAQQPIVLDVGHGAAFHMTHPNYPGGFVTLLS